MTAANFSISNASVKGDTVTFSYSNAKTGENEYISAVIENNGEITHYGRILQLDGTESGASGMARLTLPEDVTLQRYDKAVRIQRAVQRRRTRRYQTD